MCIMSSQQGAQTCLFSDPLWHRNPYCGHSSYATSTLQMSGHTLLILLWLST